MTERVFGTTQTEWDGSDKAVLTETSRIQLTSAISILSRISGRGWIYPQDMGELTRVFGSLEADHIEVAA